MDLNLLKDEIAARLDVMEFLDIIGMELPDILYKFEEEIHEFTDALTEACRY